MCAPHLDHEYPKAAVTTEVSNEHFIFKWELETLTNEVLATPKRVRQKTDFVRSLNTRNYGTIVKIANVLRRLETPTTGTACDRSSSADGPHRQPAVRLATRIFR